MAKDLEFSWPRRWAPREAAAAFAGLDLLPPAESWLYPDVRTFQLHELDHVPLLALLGQLGGGKTTEIEASLERLKARGVEVAYIDLTGIDSGAHLHAVLAGRQELTAWRGGATLHMFVDGLDRRLVDMVVVQQELERALTSDADAAARLRLRIACRTADWESAVGDDLSRLWPEPTDEDGPRFMELELLGLSEDDVRHAACLSDLDPDALLNEIDAQGARPIAATPITLKMLLESARSSGHIEDRTQLYRRTLVRLVSEHKPARAVAKEFAPSSELLAMAAREAAAMLLCHKPAVAVEPGGIDAAVPIKHLLGGTERDFDSDQSISVDGALLRQVLHTGLMHVDANRRATFIHQSFAEYLCAHWLTTGAVTANQIPSLLINPHDPQRRLVPHLRDVAAWLMTLSPSTFGFLVEAQSEVLLRGDVSVLNAKARETLVFSLLKRAEVERINDWDFRVRTNLGNLAFPRLTETLLTAINDRNAGVDTRKLAVRLAELNRVAGTVDTLTTLALSADEPDYLRADAVRAVGTIGREGDRRRLIPLALDVLPDDPNDDIKAAALQAVWPDLITTTELLGALTPPKYKRLIGTYRMFLRDAPAGLPAEDIPEAIRWVAQLDPIEPHAGLDAFADGVVYRAWEALARPEVLMALATFVVERLKEHEHLTYHHSDRRDQLLDDRARRRALLVEVVRQYPEDSSSIWIAHARPGLVRAEDIQWLCKRVGTSSGTEKAVWMDLLRTMFRPETSSPAPVFDLCATDEQAAVRFGFWLGAVALDSELAQEGRQALRTHDPDPSSDEETAEAVDMDEVLREHLDKLEDGDVAAWWHLDWDMSWSRWGTRREIVEIEPDLRKSPGWKRAGTHFRSRLVAGANSYIHNGDPEPERWFQEGKGWKPAYAGYRAFALLAAEAPDQFEQIAPDVWKRWAPAIVTFPRSNQPEMDDRVLKRAATVASAEIERWIVAHVVACDARGESISWLSYVRPLLSHDELVEQLLGVSANDVLTSRGREQLLESLLDAESPGVVPGARNVFTRMLSVPESPDDQVAKLGALLLRKRPAEFWDLVWPVISERDPLARMTIDEIAGRESLAVVTDCEPRHAADLYLLVEARYPMASDPPLRDGFVTADQHRVIWRQRLLNLLVQQGTTESLAALRRIASKMSQVDYLARVVREAETLLAERLWRPPQPAELFALTVSSSRRYVQSSEELASVLLDSLDRAQLRLQEGWPRAWQLWNDTPCTPKSEERLSDWIKGWLDDDLGEQVVASREPQVRPSRSGSGIGARNDLRVEIPALDGEPGVAVVVEVKRCWHQRLFAAMRSQLADDYLRSAALTHGIYVVGVYDAPNWEGPGSRRARKYSLIGWKEKLTERACQVSRETGMSIQAAVLDVSLRSDQASR